MVSKKDTDVYAHVDHFKCSIQSSLSITSIFVNHRFFVHSDTDAYLCGMGV